MSDLTQGVRKRFLPGILLLVAVLGVGSALWAGDAPAKPAVTKPARADLIDYGGIFCGSFSCQPEATYDNKTGFYSHDTVAKGVWVMLGTGMEDGAIVDLDSQRIAAVWTGGAPKLKGWLLNGQHGPTTQLTRLPFLTTTGVGWAGPDGTFTDPRADLVPPLPRPGPLPRDWLRTQGYSRWGRDTIFRFTVAGSQVLQRLSLVRAADAVGLVRSLTIAPHSGALTAVLADLPANTTSGSPNARLVAGPAAAQISTGAGRLLLTIPPSAQHEHLSVLVVGAEVPPPALAVLASAVTADGDLRPRISGGPAIWPERLLTQGTIGDDRQGFAVDSIALPETNPWQAWLRPTAIDFFPDGKRAALATANGDVFVVSGIDADLKQISWRRFAAGLHMPLGLKIVDGVIHVACRDGIMRLRDLNGDDEADTIDVLGLDLLQTPSFITYLFDLNTDARGNFIFSVGGPVRAGGPGYQAVTPHLGTLQRLSPDGERLETIATGLRMPNGSAVGPHGDLTVSDNEGTWVPATPIHWVKEGDFLGVPVTAHGRTVHPPQPLCFLPQSSDNSACSQVWVTSPAWGELNGDLLHLSYGKAGVFLVYHDEVNGVMQGGVVRLPIRLTSSAVRARFNPVDGHLYVVGLGLGQTTAGKSAGFDRVRRTGSPLRIGHSLQVQSSGLKLSFTTALDAQAAADPANFSITQWNYHWTDGYGSKYYSVTQPDQITTGESVAITSATLGADGRSVMLQVPGIRPAMQVVVRCKLPTQDGETLTTEFISTIHRVPR